MHPEIELMTCRIQQFHGMFTESFGAYLLKSRENSRKSISRMPTVRNDTALDFLICLLAMFKNQYFDEAVVHKKRSSTFILLLFLASLGKKVQS